MYWKRDIFWFFLCNVMVVDIIIWMIDLLLLESFWLFIIVDSKERIVGYFFWSFFFICCYLKLKKFLKFLFWRMDFDFFL